MRSFDGRTATVCLCVLGAAVAFVRRDPTPVAAAPSAQADVTARIVTSAQALLATLDAGSRTKVQFPFDGPQKSRWSNLPTGIFHREGLRLGDLAQAQRAAVMSLLSV